MALRSVIACRIGLVSMAVAGVAQAESEHIEPVVTVQPFSEPASPPLPRPLREVLTFMNGDGASRGARARVWETDVGPSHLTIDGGPFRDFSGTDGAMGAATLAVEIEDVRISSSVRAEKMFDPRRDEIDLHARFGASLPIEQGLRAGAEYIAEDFEAMWEPEEADGGMRRFVTLSVFVNPAPRVNVAAGPALELGVDRVQPAGRVSLDYRF